MSLPPNYNKMQMSSSSQRLRASGGGSSERVKDQSPFIHSPHGNPAFTPQKVGKNSAAADARAPKPPKAPEKPIMPYMRYSRKLWDSVKVTNPELKLWDIGKEIGAMWRELPEADKQEFIDEYETEKIQYIEAIRAHKSTPEYIAWIRYQRRFRGADGDTHDTPARGSSSKSQQQDRRIDIQPAEDDEDLDDGYSFKHVAYSRYVRNHRLINEIFSDAVVPDVRSVVTTQRMHVLKRQVQSLAMHQNKLHAELQQIEEKFENKRRKFVESSEQFQEELKKHCKPAVDEETFQKMVERQFDGLRRERLRTMEEQSKPQLPKQPEEAEQSPQTAQPQPAISSAPPSEGQSSAEPMDIDPTIKNADSDDGKSNDSIASQPQQLQEMAKSQPPVKEVVEVQSIQNIPIIPNIPVNPPQMVQSIQNIESEVPATAPEIQIAPPVISEKQVEATISVQHAPIPPVGGPPPQSANLLVNPAITPIAPVSHGQDAAAQAPNVTVPHHHLPPHPMGHNMPPYSGYPPRAPYYMPYNQAPPQNYGQQPPYQPFPYHQPYGPPPANYMPQRPQFHPDGVPVQPHEGHHNYPPGAPQSQMPPVSGPPAGPPTEAPVEQQPEKNDEKEPEVPPEEGKE